MKNCEKSQIFILSLIVILLVVTPLLSSSVRTTYLYFITNLLIIALGAQAGVLRAFSKPIDHEKKKPVVSIPQKPVVSVPQKPVVLSVLQKPMLVVPTEVVASADNSTQIKVTPRNDEDQRVSSERPEKINGLKMSSKSKSQKITGTVKTESRVRKCPSMPSLFFIGGGETETERDYSDDDDDVVLEDFHQIEEEDEVVADLSGQELLIKAENFIGNFYKQLKMQREESWKRIHGIYHKAF